MSNASVKKILRALHEKGVNLPCNRCGKQQFTVLDKIARIGVQDDFDGPTELGGINVPAAIVACENCGALTFHALGALGFPLQQEDTEDANG